MSRKKLKRKVVEHQTVERMAAEGKCITKHDDRVVFLPYSAPGDVVDYRFTKVRSKYAEAEIIKFHTPSDLRVAPFCEHYGICGGCKWQHLGYETQADFKEQQVVDQLTRIGHLELPEVDPILKAKETTFYRNKLEFTFSATRWLTNEQIQSGGEFDRRGLGFHVPGGFDKVLDINECHLQTPLTNEIRNFVRDQAKALDIPFFHIREQTGQLRNLMIRTASTSDVMVLVQFAGEMNPAIENLLETIKTSFPHITSLLYVVNNKGNETFHDLDVHTYHGKDHIIERLEDLEFIIGPKSFFQTNTTQALELYRIAREWAGLKGEELVYDLYTGTGTIANFVAKKAKRVVGIEYVPEAVEAAKVNAERNQIDNTSFFAGDMKDLLNEDFLKEHGTPDVIITDPPRAGMHADVVQTLLNIGAPKVVYISCNPATQARDLDLMKEMYKVEAVKPVDMFPQTHHVESVVLLSKI